MEFAKLGLFLIPKATALKIPFKNGEFALFPRLIYDGTSFMNYEKISLILPFKS